MARGRLPANRNRPHASGPHPDWNSVVWYVYDDPLTLPGGVRHCYRVSPRPLSPGELRRFEREVATVKRCSLRTVRELLLERNVPPAALQAAADGLADAQAARAAAEAHRPNVYRDLIEKLRPKGATPPAEAGPKAEAA